SKPAAHAEWPPRKRACPGGSPAGAWAYRRDARRAGRRTAARAPTSKSLGSPPAWLLAPPGRVPWSPRYSPGRRVASQRPDSRDRCGSASRRVQRLRLLGRQLGDDHRGRRRRGRRYRPQRHHAPVAVDAQQLPAPAHLVAEERERPHEGVEEVLRGDEPEPAQRFVLAEEPEHPDE